MNKKVKKAKRKVVLKSDEYELMAHAMTLYVKEKESQDSEEFEGCTKKEVINWYTAQNIGDLNNMEDYNDMIHILRAVLKRLIKSERVFIVVREDSNDDMNSLIRMHPNHDMGTL